jgi:hypothetical protein
MQQEPLFSKQAKILLAAACLILAGIFGFGLTTTVRDKGRVPVEVMTAPREAKVFFNDKPSPASAMLSPGHYTLKVSYPGFDTKTQTFDVRDGDSKRTFPVELHPQTAEAQQIAAAERERYTQVEGVGSSVASKAGEDFVKSNPIAAFLPKHTGYYNIDYAKDANGNFVVQISATAPIGRQVALQQIRDWGFDPTDYRIQFVGLNNPFAAGGNR